MPVLPHPGFFVTSFTVHCRHLLEFLLEAPCLFLSQPTSSVERERGRGKPQLLLDICVRPTTTATTVVADFNGWHKHKSFYGAIFMQLSLLQRHFPIGTHGPPLSPVLSVQSPLL